MLSINEAAANMLWQVKNASIALTQVQPIKIIKPSYIGIDLNCGDEKELQSNACNVYIPFYTLMIIMMAVVKLPTIVALLAPKTCVHCYFF